MIEKGCVVIPTAGKEQGRPMVILSTEKGIWLADGRHRRLEHPKRKNPRHLRSTPFRVGEEALATNRQLRRALAALAVQANEM